MSFITPWATCSTKYASVEGILAERFVGMCFPSLVGLMRPEFTKNLTESLVLRRMSAALRSASTDGLLPYAFSGFGEPFGSKNLESRNHSASADPSRAESFDAGMRIFRAR